MRHHVSAIGIGFFKNAPIIPLFARGRRIVRDRHGGNAFQTVRVFLYDFIERPRRFRYPVAKRLFPSPQHLVRQIGLFGKSHGSRLQRKRATNQVFFAKTHPWMVPHLGRNRQIRVHPIAVQKRRAWFQSMRRDGFVRPEHIERVDFSQEPACFPIKFDGIGASVHVQIAPRHLVRPVPIQNDLGLTVRANVLANQIIPNAGAHRRGIVGFNRANDFGDGVEKILFGKNNFGMFAANMVGHQARILEIFRIGQPNAVGLNRRQGCARVDLITFSQIARNGRDQTAIQSPRQQTRHRSFRGEETFVYRTNHRISDLFAIGRENRIVHDIHGRIQDGGTGQIVGARRLDGRPKRMHAAAQ